MSIDKMIEILDENNIKYRYDSGWGGYQIYDEFDTVCKDEGELKEYIESTLGIMLEQERCWKCKNIIDEFCYSPTAYYKDGTKELIEDIITGMTEEDMTNYEEDMKKEDKEIDHIEFGEFCPHCLSCM